MIGVLDPGIQIGDPVIGLVLEVQFVGVVDEPGAEGERQPALQVPDHGVDEGGRHRDAEPLQQQRRERPHVLLDYVFH
jgi:hypothetical protein